MSSPGVDRFSADTGVPVKERPAPSTRHVELHVHRQESSPSGSSTLRRGWLFRRSVPDENDAEDVFAVRSIADIP